MGSLMFSEIERRIDVVIFRACLAHSAYDARRMVVHGQVLLNGKKVCYHCLLHPSANTLVSIKTRTPALRRATWYLSTQK